MQGNESPIPDFEKEDPSLFWHEEAMAQFEQENPLPYGAQLPANKNSLLQHLTHVRLMAWTLIGKLNYAQLSQKRLAVVSYDLLHDYIRLKGFDSVHALLCQPEISEGADATGSKSQRK